MDFSSPQQRRSFGGGFMQDGSPGMASQSASAERKPRKELPSLTPITFVQLKHAEIKDGKFFIDDREVSYVSVVGKVIQFDTRETTFNVTLDDSTDRQEVVKYIEKDDVSQDQVNITEGRYAKVFGHLRVHGQERSVQAFHIQPITDFNEVTYHILDVIRTHLALTKGPIENQKKNSSHHNNSLPNQNEHELLNSSFSHQQGSFSSSSSSSSSSSALPGLAGQVLRIIEQEGTGETGCSLQAVCERLRLPTDQISKAIEWLTNEGHLYTTTDDTHFKSTS